MEKQPGIPRADATRISSNFKLDKYSMKPIENHDSKRGFKKNSILSLISLTFIQRAHSLQFSQAFELMGVIFSIVKFVPLKQTPIQFVHLN